MENIISKNNKISKYLNYYENRPFKEIHSKILFYLVGYPFMFLQKLTNKTSGVIYVFIKK